MSCSIEVPMAKITVLGLGAMGSRMAAALMKAGHEVTVWNRSEGKAAPLVAAGARNAATLREGVSDAEFAISMVRDVAASREVWLGEADGALTALPERCVAIESSTVTVAWAQDLASTFAAQGRRFLEAPVIGTLPQADSGQLIYLGAGDQAVFAEAQPVLANMATATHYTGAAGSAATLKLAVNSLYAIQIAALAELLGVVQRSGFDVALAAEVLGSTRSASPAVKLAAQAMMARDFKPLFTLELVDKDLGYAVEAAANRHAAIPVLEAAHRVFAETLVKGFGQDGIAGVAQLYL